jgi:hypothetical protein
LEQSLVIPARVRLVEPGTMEDYSNRLGQIIDERSNGYTDNLALPNEYLLDTISFSLLPCAH